MHRPPIVAKRFPSIEVLAATSAHSIRFSNGRAQCRTCACSLPLAPAGVLRDWLSTSCIPIPTSFSRPEPLPYCRIQLGRQTAHPSHHMYVFKGFLFCMRCGNRGVEKFHLLSRACEPCKVGNGAATLSAIRADKLPPGLKVWPCDNCRRSSA